MKTMNIFIQSEYNQPSTPTFARKMHRPSEHTTQVASAYRPVLNSWAMALTMDNYRIFVALYNEKIKNENIIIENENAQVISTENLSLIQSEIKKTFLKRYGFYEPYFCMKTGLQKRKFVFFTGVSFRDFNQEAQKINDTYGRIIKKQKIQPIKSNTEQIFQQILYVYSLQLEKENTIYKTIGSLWKRPVPRVRICSSEITYLKRNGHKVLNLCNKTIQNHRKRLEEAGVLVDYALSGSHKMGGVKHHINPQILVVFCEKDQKICMAENQLVTLPSGKKVTDITMNKQETFKNKEKIRANNTDLPQKKCQLVLTKVSIQEPLYKNTTSKEKNFGAAAAAAPQKLSTNFQKNVNTTTEHISEYFSKSVLPPFELCQRLANGEYEFYKPLDIRYFYHEMEKGTLLRDEFQEIVAQEFLKHAARLWKGKNVYAGSWFKAYENIKQGLYSQFLKNVFPKSQQVDTLSQWRWRLAYAGRYCAKNTGFQLLFPSEYFNPSRNSKKEGGFAYTKKAWENHLKSAENTQKRQYEREKNAKKRKIYLSEIEKVEKECKKFLKGSISLAQLYDFIQKKHPNFIQKLGSIIQKLSNKH